MVYHFTDDKGQEGSIPTNVQSSNLNEELG